MRLMRISLATKYRVLFGLAVLLIIGAALFVPWYRMEALVKEQPFREAQRVADDYFRLVMPATGATGGSVHGQDVTVLPEQPYLAAKFVRLEGRPVDPAAATNPQNADPFVLKALWKFARDPASNFTWEHERAAEGWRFQYALAVRVARSCLECHDEGKTARPYRENQLAGVIAVDLPADEGGRGVVYNRLIIIAAGALAGILAILVFYIITQKFILAPIHELREVASRVGEGDLDLRATVRTGDEFEQLSDSLNNMLERLRDARDELRRANRALDQKLGEMAETNVALYEANRVKSEFLANVSHELRTPLTSIIGFAELLREGPHAGDGQRTARYAENILISGRILLEIINDLLDLAKIEAGKVELRVEPVRLDELCTSLVEFTRVQADKKNLRVGIEVDEVLPVVFTDRGKVRQIVFNLLSNAVKFTPEQGQVRVLVRRVDEEHLQIEVHDTGPGIAPEHHQAVFEKFRQIDQSATREHAGTGLGLAISRELTHMLGGQIRLESELGKGARFLVTLPLTAPQPSERPLVSLV